jgi:hypothetical protein
VPALERIPAIRIVATPAALDALAAPAGALLLRLAADEALLVHADLTGHQAAPPVDDAHAIIEFDAGFAGAWWTIDEARRLLERHCEWAPPAARPAFAQGAIAEIAAKVWFEETRALILVPAPFQTDFEERSA